MIEKQNLIGISDFGIIEACFSIEFHELDNLSEGDIIFECFKMRSVKAKVISKPQKSTIEYKHGVYETWIWNAEIVEVLKYKHDNGKYYKIRVDYDTKIQEYLVSNSLSQGQPSLYTKDIYQYLYDG